MSGESGSERTQRTVAELLAQYGGKPGEGGQRRRRRRAEDSSDTAPQTIINRVLSDSGRLLPVREEDQHRGAHSPHRRAESPRPPARYQESSSGYADPATGYRQPAPTDSEAQTRYLPPPPVPGEPATELIPRVTARPGEETGSTQQPTRAGQPAQEAWFDDPAYPDIEHTQTIPPAGSLDHTQAHPLLEDTQGHPGPYGDHYDEHGYPGYPGAAERFADEDFADDEVDDEGGTEEDLDAELADAERSPGKEWLVMVGQLAAGVIGGALLWLVFEWLWRTLPAAALGVAVLVTVGLVLIVRRIRRADDLQTTVLAVLVGLVVTVSPAALLLVGQ
jgi:hypothetical protein